MITLTEILGNAGDPALSGRLHELAHSGRVETLRLPPRDAARARLRAITDKGTDCAIALPRGLRLEEGSVLLLERERAIVVRLGAEAWQRFRPRDAAAALTLGYHAGNLHWRVRFDGADLLVAVETTAEALCDRLRDLLDTGAVEARDD